MTNGSVPCHIAVIMDGNGRWAKKRFLPRKAGHSAGSEVFRRIACYCRDIGVQYLTVYAFSTENWKRPQDEIDEIFSLLDKYLDEVQATMLNDNVAVRFLGNLSHFPSGMQRKIDNVHKLSDGYPSGVCQVNICVNYGGRDEIVRAAESILKNPPEILDENSFAQRLDTKGIPCPDLLIRPGGDFRISNFLLWQIAYTEFYFTKILWPDFSEKELAKAIAEYNKRKRRFGGV
ncbi:MAG: polyprenyl diphosphate synthase [Oscillospiraceae bacterium]|nr:polyprenyl diphosphate synthase [Oscillospiraceae bacterium]